MYENGLKTKDFRGGADFGHETTRPKKCGFNCYRKHIYLEKWRRVELTGWILAGRVDKMDNLMENGTL